MYLILYVIASAAASCMASGQEATNASKARTIVYDMAIYWESPCYNCHGYNCECLASIYRVPAFSIEVRDEKNVKTSEEYVRAVALAESSLKAGFSYAAETALMKYADENPDNLQEGANTICRARRRKPSVVLPSPYFEDVEYCTKLIPAHHYALDVDEGHQFNIRIQMSIDVTKNPASGYREPDRNEEQSYRDAAGEISKAMQNLTATRLAQQGWLLDKIHDSIIMRGMSK